MTRISRLLNKIYEAFDYPNCGHNLDGYTVGDQVSNQASIEASLDNYKIRPGIKAVPMSDFQTELSALFYSASDKRHSKELAEKMKNSKVINPLIVVIDKDGPYVLEGVHRLGALGLMGVTHFPAMVVDDES